MNKDPFRHLTGAGIRPEFSGEDHVDQLYIEFASTPNPEMMQYFYEAFPDYWQCACGSQNEPDQRFCGHCGVEHAWLIMHCAPTYLAARIMKRKGPDAVRWYDAEDYRVPNPWPDGPPPELEPFNLRRTLAAETETPSPRRLETVRRDDERVPTTAERASTPDDMTRRIEPVDVPVSDATRRIPTVRTSDRERVWDTGYSRAAETRREPAREPQREPSRQADTRPARPQGETPSRDDSSDVKETATRPERPERPSVRTEPDDGERETPVRTTGVRGYGTVDEDYRARMAKERAERDRKLREQAGGKDYRELFESRRKEKADARQRALETARRQREAQAVGTRGAKPEDASSPETSASTTTHHAVTAAARIPDKDSAKPPVDTRDAERSRGERGERARSEASETDEPQGRGARVAVLGWGERLWSLLKELDPRSIEGGDRKDADDSSEEEEDADTRDTSASTETAETPDTPAPSDDDKEARRSDAKPAPSSERAHEAASETAAAKPARSGPAAPRPRQGVRSGDVVMTIVAGILLLLLLLWVIRPLREGPTSPSYSDDPPTHTVAKDHDDPAD